ncbi:hypothetical protein AAVH_26643 [Aphelenchoides avenae]|nr:hypothetical protein AAVH_26643 [Aphelenchus avenae]
MHCTPGYTCEQGRVCRPGRDCNVDDCDYMDGAAYVGNLSPACNNVTGLCDHTQMQFAFAAGQWGPRTTCYQMSNTTCQYNQECVLDPNSNCKCKKCISNGPLCYE